MRRIEPERRVGVRGRAAQREVEPRLAGEWGRERGQRGQRQRAGEIERFARAAGEVERGGETGDREPLDRNRARNEPRACRDGRRVAEQQIERRGQDGIGEAETGVEGGRGIAVRDPRGVLKEFGIAIGDDVEVRVWDSTAEQRYLVVPQRPAGTEGLGEEALAALVTRNSMIGTDRDLKARG